MGEILGEFNSNSSSSMIDQIPLCYIIQWFTFVKTTVKYELEHPIKQNYLNIRKPEDTENEKYTFVILY